MDNEITLNVERAANLARLVLTPGEKARLEDELPRTMAGLRARLRAVDVSGAEPMIYGGNTMRGWRGDLRCVQVIFDFLGKADATRAWREDAPGSMLDRAEALQQAPERLGDEFKMPRIVE